MTLFKVECPRCRALQKFGEKRRRISEDEYEYYIQCYYCRWKETTIVGNPDKIRKDRKTRKIRGLRGRVQE